MSGFTVDAQASVRYGQDGLQGMIHALGDPNRDKAASVHFTHKVIDDRELIAAYETNWMARGVVDIPVMDSLRKGWRWGGDNHEAIATEELRLCVRKKLMQAFKKGRLFGGAAVYIGTDQDESEPLDVEKIQKGGVKYLSVMTRLQLNAGEIDMDPMSDYYGTPKEYQISSPIKGQVAIHPSRLVIFNGDERADNITTPSSHGWAGTSVIQSTYDAITNAVGSHGSVASLIYEANIDVLGIPKLMENMQRDKTGEYQKSLMARLVTFAQSKGVNGMGVIDADEVLNRRSASFANLHQLMETFAVFVAAAAQIPATRFLAQSPSGLVSTGESDMKNYYDTISSMQELEVDPNIELLNRCVIRSATGSSEPVSRIWQPLEQMSDADLSKMGKEIAETIKIMAETGAIEQNEARALFVHKMAECGSMPHIEETLDTALGSLSVDA